MASRTDYPCAIIDGYTEQGFIKGVPGIHPPCRFLYRRMLGMVQDRVHDAINRGGDPGSRDATWANEIVGKTHLIRWDLKYRDGTEIPLTADNFARLTPLLAYRIRNIICGVDPPDIDDEAPHLAAQVQPLTEERLSAEAVDAKN